MTTVTQATDGDRLGKYRILREIGRSNDIVYEAYDTEKQRRIAVKELRLPDYLTPGQQRERISRFRREARAVCALSHSNIVSVYEVGHDNGRYFIAMEYLDGRTLRELIQMQGALPQRLALDIATQICGALAYAHGRGVIHRDIKPDNIVLLRNGTAKLMDFGLARISSEPNITEHGQVFGTPSYMAPEQIMGKSVDQRSDLFALGVTLYEMMTGRKPFQGDGVITITYNIMNTAPDMPPNIPAKLYTIMTRTLAKSPTERFQNATDLANLLRAEIMAIDRKGKGGAEPQIPIMDPRTSPVSASAANRSVRAQVVGTEAQVKSAKFTNLMETLVSQVEADLSAPQAAPKATITKPEPKTIPWKAIAIGVIVVMAMVIGFLAGNLNRRAAPAPIPAPVAAPAAPTDASGAPAAAPTAPPQ